MVDPKSRFSSITLRRLTRTYTTRCQKVLKAADAEGASSSCKDEDNRRAKRRSGKGVQSDYPGCRLQFNVEGRRIRRYRRTVETAFRQAECSGEFALSEVLKDIIAQEQDHDDN